MSDVVGKLVRATFMHAPIRGKVEICQDALIDVGADGIIAQVICVEDASYDAALANAGDRLVSLPTDQILLPGFVDLHIHAPQWPQLGKALDVPLEDWLQTYTFPLEARYADLEFAKRVYGDLVSSLLAHGTTTAVYFATIHDAASRHLARTCLELGQRAFVGKVVMDDASQCPDYYRDASTEQAVEETGEFMEFVSAMPGNEGALVHPIITPRFIPSCTDAALTVLGDMAQTHGYHVQTHCSESDWEHAYVIERTGKTDTEALKDFGLLGRHTVLAHSNFLTESDMDTVHDVGAGVAHCPLSNVYFSNAVFPLRRALEKSLRVGLGTDISGGPSPSIFDACRHAISSSRLLEEGVDPATSRDERRIENSRIDFREAFYLATVGGADVLDIPVGQFTPGYAFDAMMIDPNADDAPISFQSELDSDEDKLQKIISLAGRPNVAAVWTQGKLARGSL